MSKRKSLGRGLDALLGQAPAGAGRAVSADVTAANPPKTPAAPAANEGAQKMAVERLSPGEFQPRRVFDEAAVRALADSIRQHGVLQPLLARPLAAGGFEIVAGERRWRAAQLAGLASVPVVVRELDDRDALFCALAENIHREGLSAAEQARGIRRLADEFHLTHEALAARLGMSRPAITNLLRLLDLPKKVLQMIEDGALAAAAARALLSLPSAQQEAAAAEISRRGLNARQAEAMVKQMKNSATRRRSTTSTRNADTARLERELAEILSAPVRIVHRNRGGKVELKYASLDALERLLARLRKAAGG